MKRAFDILASALGLVIAGPIILAAALAVRLADRGPAFFRQERIGRNLVPFRMLKLRTMVVDAERTGPAVTVRSDGRVTPIGRWLRRTKLDELPQLVNVLRGEMSLVGPRPELPQYVRLFEDEFRDILKVRPGLTDVASIAYRCEADLLEGVEDPERKYVREILPDKLRLARAYVERASFAADLGLIARTLFALAYPSDAVERFFDRPGRRFGALTTLAQLALLVGSNLAAMWLRYGGAPPRGVERAVLLGLPLLVLVRFSWLAALRLNRDVWRYVGPRELWALIAAGALGTVSLWAIAAGIARAAPGLEAYPASVLLLDGILGTAALVGVRLFRRLHHELDRSVPCARRVIVVGPADAVARLLPQLTAGHGRTHDVAGLVVDRPSEDGLRVHGMPILGGFDRLERIVAERTPDAVLVAASALAEPSLVDALKRCRAAGRLVHVVPDVEDVLAGREARVELATPDTEDLLFRDPVRVDVASLAECFRGRRVMVTGAGGSIGIEICAQVAAFAPARLTLFEKHEAALYDADRRLRQRHPALALDAWIGDVRDAARIEEVLATCRPEVVFHAAAYKHVPLMERNAGEALKTNVRGTSIVAEACGRSGVEVFVLISTDKAVEPVSVMGASKRLAELAVQGLVGRYRTRYLTVRFGNVLGSSGSVVPLFREQIEHDGPVTVTHSHVTRWFMTVSEAVQLILEASRLGRGGEVFILDMGRPVRILDLAESMIRQHGLEPDRDVPIVFTGLRPGERLFEKLTNDDETVWKTAHPRIFMAVSVHANGHARERRLHEVRRLMDVFQLDDGTRSAPEVRRVVEALERSCA